jgi:peptidoglycan/xylan/chitin deacetylase (PgdA/CDA1 family)
LVKEKTVFPVLLTFDLDGEFAFEEIHPGIPYWTTQGEYGPRVGVYRILDLLHRENITATFCVVGKTAEKYPEAVEAIVEKGHEIAVHGYTHRGYNALEPEQERDWIQKTRDILSSFTGKPPLGHRTPRWRPSRHTHRFLKELGFLWNSDHMGSEVPFYNEIDGRKSKLLEIPVAYNLDDWTFYFDWGTPVRDVLEVWRIEFDSRYRDRSVFCLTNHPQVSGRPSRIVILEKLIEYMKKRPDVRFMSCAEYVKEFFD